LQFFLHSSASLKISRYINGLNNKKDQDSSLAVSHGVFRRGVPWRQTLPDARLHQPQNWRELGSLQNSVKWQYFLNGR
jgi:hypothetical protein